MATSTGTRKTDRKLTLVAAGKSFVFRWQPTSTALGDVVRWFLEHYHYSRHIPPEAYQWSIRKDNGKGEKPTWYLFDKVKLAPTDCLTNLEAVVSVISDTKLGIWTTSRAGYYAAEVKLTPRTNRKLILLPKPTSI